MVNLCVAFSTMNRSRQLEEMGTCEISKWQRLKEGLNNLNFEAFCKGFSADLDAICLDVRTPGEFNSGHIDRARNINYLSENLPDLLEELDPEKTYYIYCRTSRRSIRVCILLKNMGFKNIYNLEEGIQYLKPNQRENSLI